MAVSEKYTFSSFLRRKHSSITSQLSPIPSKSLTFSSSTGTSAAASGDSGSRASATRNEERSFCSTSRRFSRCLMRDSVLASKPENCLTESPTMKLATFAIRFNSLPACTKAREGVSITLKSRYLACGSMSVSLFASGNALAADRARNPIVGRKRRALRTLNTV